MYTLIAPFARIPDVYPSTLDQRALVSSFTQPQIPAHLSDLPLHDIRENYLSFVIQSIPGAMNYVCAGLSLTYHFPSRQMYIFMHGLATETYDRFARDVEEGAANESAFIIPSMIVQHNLSQLGKVIDRWHDEIYWHERALGIRYDHHDSIDLANLDFTALSRTLNAANTQLAYIAWSCKSTARLLDFLNQVTDRYRQQAMAHGEPEKDIAHIIDLLSGTHEHLRAWNAGLQDRTEYLSKRGQALVQTIYSGIAQRDAATSLSLASTSTSLARSSQSVAISTSRDSAIMKIIAAMTMIFLPATFTATFFSTTFFDFNNDLNGRMYSSWLWLYFLVTFVLTFVVMLVTWWLWKKKEKEVNASLDAKLEMSHSNSQAL
ncbi:hypothetical protein COCC4DRAFT_130791 [Bipolaris maydis ATCC 48331]|uniref:Uncharacterized protein n=3 Tax=Cochliobolus heterostrophus TaxID=5016 RepID=M2UWI8_COCH5|nr:uncharacterized protein COCC4DRAFT_130791 [Bipolaris maydis ATCC 48331]EMD92193.1 hypothetical protein COCHEDRAFT_1155180 [Bipolaris maydis C5]ENI07885.1 hypothetical protein COCC4DRAFT_130791 [Bipolaris maydis ATCC 48331]KAJ6209996.1 hypothetical protein PSV09DRAFT_1155180 [Bipolaris maydis]